MDEKLPTPASPGSSFDFQKLLIFSAVILVVLVIGLNVYLERDKFGSLLQQRKELSLSPTPGTATPSRQTDLESCNVKKEGNPLVGDVRTLEDGTIVGNFRGNINKVEGDPTREVVLEVVSPKADQTYTFKVKPEDGLVYDTTVQKDLTLAGLGAGNSVIMSFNCFPEKNNLFKITRIAITGRLQ